MLETTDVAWAAGFIDGEGSIAALSGKACIQLGAAQIVREPLDKLREMFGGWVGPSKTPWGMVFLWHTSRHKAATALESMLPYLVVKHKAATIALDRNAGRLSLEAAQEALHRANHRRTTL